MKALGRALGLIWGSGGGLAVLFANFLAQEDNTAILQEDGFVILY
jgi:hypothetical protein